MKELKEILDKHYHIRNNIDELSDNKPDPLVALKNNLHLKHIDEIAVISALLSYGNAGQILKTLRKLDFSILNDRSKIQKAYFPLYRFQSSEDIRAIFLCMNKIIYDGGIKNIFVESYFKENNVISGINAMIEVLRSNVEMTRGLDFLIGRASKHPISSSPLKRWNMFLRWFVRKDNIDLGFWSDKVNKKDLILPLDTHTFRLSKKLGLLSRKIYDLASAIEITNNLKIFCEDDPVKYDFALYRLGQEKLM
ncbi:TIGR02757 family protein [Helicobacter sp. MIT 14-3879]|uniref:TIGR02757 family protein n=1 Tax=Helicobacter sp. MIT 14-3879 TaxID=2040649 RepID=UPI000E1E891A|nr:TIGR02757 family protein [Helicobacter sp. MIT 14-3879]RDU64703.1 TIGR02757 family protein [Helicobacter sp. MIT 14-3879]